MGARDRALVADGTFAYLRRKRSLEALAQSTLPRHLALAIAVREFAFSVRELTPAISATDAEWLAAFKARLHDTLPPAVAADVPDWLWERLGDVYGDDGRAALTRSWQIAAPLDLRVNVMKTSRDEALAALTAEGIEAIPTPFSPTGIRIDGRPSMASHPWVVDGRLEVQDEGSQLIGTLVAPKRNDMVVDFCAGAGGKTLLLGAMMRSQGRLYAFDVVARRLQKMTPRLARSGLSNVHPQLIAHERDAKVKRLAGKIDRVLVDAPCTGFGTLRRNPDLKWRQTPQDLAELAAKQARILDAASMLVKPGGRVVYATCSVLPEENDAIVDAFLASHPTFGERAVAPLLAHAGIALDTGPRLRLLPHLHGCDGFFAAVLERNP
jgi:16S rRNA (cytosine967-C5)-methyltransferase